MKTQWGVVVYTYRCVCAVCVLCVCGGLYIRPPYIGGSIYALCEKTLRGLRVTVRCARTPLCVSLAKNAKGGGPFACALSQLGI